MLKPDDARERRYLDKVLALSPDTELANILAARRQYLDADSATKEGLGRRAVVSPEVDAHESDRERAERTLSEIHDQFWEESEGQVGARLVALTLDRFPDLERYRQRLLRVDDLREDFYNFEERPKVDRKFVDALSAILIAPERKAAELKRRLVGVAGQGAARRAARRSISILSSTSRDLFSLEASLFKNIKKAKKDRKDSRAVKGGLGCLAFWLLMKGGLVLLRFVIDWFQEG